MLIIKYQELESQGYYKSSLKLLFKDKQFKEAGCFSRNKLQAAIKFCHELLEQGVDCLLVEHHSFFTVWQQIPSEPKLSESKPGSQTSSQPAVVEQQIAFLANLNERKLNSIVNSSIQNISDNKTVTKSTSSTLTKEFIEQCEQELTRCVGPIAIFILEDALAQSGQVEATQLVEILAKEIPDLEKAQEFRQKFR